MALSTFPGQGSIPPPCFYNFGGFATYLNQNPSYKLTFAELLPNGPIITSTISSLGYDITKIPLCPDVTTMSFNQAHKYDKQINLFKKVYGYNLDVYTRSITNGTTPIYYNFVTYNELMEYRAGVGVINKLYPFQIMSEYWSFPFPITY